MSKHSAQRFALKPDRLAKLAGPTSVKELKKDQMMLNPMIEHVNYNLEPPSFRFASNSVEKSRELKK